MKEQQPTLFGDNPEYALFLKKFETKKTTDDCYTPPLVMEAVQDWVATEFHLDKTNFVRPFRPNGDYQCETYKPTDIVVDNPPFSILAEIINFYIRNNIKFFLFAPYLTLLSGAAVKVTCYPVSLNIVYANGANVCTAFVSNLDDPDTIIRIPRTLIEKVGAAVKKEKERLKNKRALPVYSYPPNIVTVSRVFNLRHKSNDLVIKRTQTAVIDRLDSQRMQGKAIFGKGLLVSDQVADALEKLKNLPDVWNEPEPEPKPESEPLEWILSERERAIIDFLNNKNK